MRAITSYPIPRLRQELRGIGGFARSLVGKEFDDGEIHLQ